MITNEYSQDFQVKLLINMVLNKRFFESTLGQVRVEDFGTPACRIIYEVVRNYYTTYKRLPPFSTLETEILRALHDTSGNTLTSLSPMDLEPLTIIMGWLARTRDSELDPDYFSARLPGFIGFVRLAEIQGKREHSTVNDYITSVTSLQTQLSGLGSTEFVFHDAMEYIPDELGSARARIGWGVKSIDDKLGGGITRQQSGLVVACTGVGKTTTMLGIAAHAARKGKHSLFITIELPYHKIIERSQMLLAVIEAKWFKTPRTQWPAAVRDRWNLMAHPDMSPVSGSVSIIEKIGNCTVFDIDRMIYSWKDGLAKKGKNPDDCELVFVDWLDRIDPSGIARLGKGESEERVFFRVFEKLDELKVKHDIRVWTATQAGKSGEGKEVLTRKDTHFGQSKHHLADVSMGVAPKAGDRVEANTDDEFVVDSANPNEDLSMAGVVTEPPCDRDMVISYMKTRDSSATGQHAFAYQGPTLQLWQNKQTAETATRIVQGGDTQALMNMLGDRLKGTTNAQPVTVGGGAPV